MGKFTVDEVEHYGGSGGTGFFKLSDDGDKARVRILYNDIKDVEGYAVHRVKVPGSKFGKDVNCLRNYNDPVDVCPFCREKIPQQAMLYIPLYNIDEDSFQIWSRGKKYFHRISSLCSRYPNLVSHIFEIERAGKANDKQTDYQFFEMGEDETILEDFDYIPDPMGGALLDKSAEDMKYYLENGEFPPDEEEEEEEMPRRRTTSRKDEDDDLSSGRPTSSKRKEEDTKPRRRTAPNNRRREAF